MEDPHRRLIEKRYFSPRGKRRKSRTGRQQAPGSCVQPKGHSPLAGKNSSRRCGGANSARLFKDEQKGSPGTCRVILFQVSPSPRPAGRFVCYAHKNTRFEANTGKYPCLARA